jgi:hypothetical protein
MGSVLSLFIRSEANVGIRTGAAAIALIVAIGCNSKTDLNKDLKPIDPNAPPPKMGTENPAGEKKNKGDGAPSVVK